MLPPDYLQARKTFLDLAGRAGAEVRRFYLEDKGGEEPLSTDVAWLGPANASALLIIASGTHGIEGYAGSACQFRFLHEYRARHADSKLGFLLVHAVNPWGYFHDRRVTREGIDLNRNFVDFPLAPDVGCGYDAFHDRLVTKYRPLPAGWWNELCLMSGALSRSRRKAIQTAVTAGQYRHADGLFYGGQAAAESRIVWEAIVDHYAQNRQRLFLLDIHTGLGKYGVGELITHLPASSQEFHHVSEWFNGEPKSMSSGESVSAAVGGTLTAAFERRFPVRSQTLGLEFGTVPALSVLNAMRADHWYHRHAEQLEPREREWVRSKMKQAFAPADETWHAQVTARFDQVLGWTIAALSR